METRRGEKSVGSNIANSPHCGDTKSHQMNGNDNHGSSYKGREERLPELNENDVIIVKFAGSATEASFAAG